jgi:hypothetical protein
VAAIPIDGWAGVVGRELVRSGVRPASTLLGLRPQAERGRGWRVATRLVWAAARAAHRLLRRELVVAERGASVGLELEPPARPAVHSEPVLDQAVAAGVVSQLEPLGCLMGSPTRHQPTWPTSCGSSRGPWSGRPSQAAGREPSDRDLECPRL